MNSKSILSRVITEADTNLGQKTINLPAIAGYGLSLLYMVRALKQSYDILSL